MRFIDIARFAALLSLSAVLSACPKKDTDAVPEPPAPGAAQAPVSDKAGALTEPARSAPSTVGDVADEHCNQDRQHDPEQVGRAPGALGACFGDGRCVDTHRVAQRVRQLV